MKAEKALQIIDLVARKITDAGMEVTYDQIISSSRKRSIVMARGLVCFIMRQHEKMALTAIGDVVNRHHATIIHNETMTISDIENNEIIAKAYREICDAYGYYIPIWIRTCPDNEKPKAIVKEERKVVKVTRPNKKRMPHYIDKDDMQMGIGSTEADYIKPETYGTEFKRNLRIWRKQGAQ